MGKFILTNLKEKTEESICSSESHGYHVSGRFNGAHISYASFYKLSVENENYFCAGEDFVSVIGTIIYKDLVGADALSAIYDDFTGDVNLIRDNVIGNGAFVIKKRDRIFVFCEYLALYRVYYTFNQGCLIISNDMYDLCKLCNGLKLDEDNMILKALIAGVYGSETEIQDVYRLHDNQVIVINDTNGLYEVVNVEVDWRCDKDLNYDEVVKEISSILKKDASSIAKHFGIPALSSTGGLDNRLNLAAFLYQGIRPDLYYGIGNSPITNTYSGDLEVDNEFKERFNLNLNVISWENSIPIDRDWKEVEDLYGFHSVHYGGSIDFNNNYRIIPNNLILFGCFGEIYRLDDNIYQENINFKDVTLDQYIDLYVLGLNYNSEQLLFKNNLDGIRSHVKEKLLCLCKKWDINPDKITSEDDFILSIERMRDGDTNIPNLMNRHHYCMFLNAQFPIVKLMTLVHPRMKSNAKFHLDVLKSIYPEVLEIPIYSRAKFWIYDFKTNTMRLPSTYTYKSRFLKLSSNICPVIVKAYYKIKPFFVRNKKLDENDYGKRVAETLSQILAWKNMEDGRDYKMFINQRMEKCIALYAQELSIMRHLGVDFCKLIRK